MPRRWTVSLMTALAIVFGPVASGHELPEHTSAGRADTINRPTCHPSNAMRWPETELVRALSAHDVLDAMMARKFETGYYSGPINARSTVHVIADDLLLNVTRTLKGFSQTGARTAALIFAEASVERLRCIWLVDETGLISFDVVEYGERDSGLALRAHIERHPPDLTEWRDALDDASNAVLPPALADRIDHDRLLILAVGGVSDFPFAAIMARGEPLGARTAIVQLSGAASLASDATYRFSRPSANASALIVGDPLYPEHPEFGRLPQLAWARKEALAVADLHAFSTVLLGDEATVHAFEQSVGQASVIHLATHGLADGANPLDGSVLAFAGGFLTARRISELDVSARSPLVVMSACQTGLGRNFPNGVFGLARAWLRAGAGQVVMSQWDVADEETAALMTAFHRRLQEEPRPEFALRDAMRRVRANVEHPYYWAGFSVFGAPAQ